VEEAQRDVTEAEKAHTRNSPEYRAAVSRLRDATLDFKAAQIELARQGGLTKDELATHLRSLGTLTDEMIDEIIADFERINAFQFRAKTIRVTHEVTGGGVQEFDTGGVVQGPRGAPVLIKAHAGETVLPTHKGPTLGLATSAPAPIVINVSSLDPRGAGRAVVQAIQEYERANGDGWRRR
jgi:hypothetical protein